MVKFEWTDKVLSAINSSTTWGDDTRERVFQILSEFKEAQNSTCNQQTKVLISALKFGYHAREDGASLESTINQYKSLQKQ